MTTADKDKGRKALHAYVSDDAHDHWHGFASEQGVSVSALLECLSPVLYSDVALSEQPFGEVFNEVVKNSRRLDAKRRRRKS